MFRSFDGTILDDGDDDIHTCCAHLLQYTGSPAGKGKKGKKGKRKDNKFIGYTFKKNKSMESGTVVDSIVDKLAKSGGGAIDKIDDSVFFK